MQKIIEKVIEIVKTAIEKNSCVVVLSAMQGATDALINIAKAAESGDENFREKIKELETKHFETAQKLLSENSRDGGIFDFIENRFNELKNICEGVFLLRELSVANARPYRQFRRNSFDQNCRRKI